MDINRREAVSIGGAGLVTALAGCQALASNSDSTLALQINNYAPSQQEIEVEVIDPGKDESSEALVYRVPENDVALEIPPKSEGEEDAYTSRVFEDIAEPTRHTVYARLRGDDPDQWRHFHYIPQGDDDYYKIFISIYQNENTGESGIEFRR